MIGSEIERSIEEQKRKGDFIYPFYERYCFSNIPSTILKFFNVGAARPTLPTDTYDRVEVRDVDKVVLLLVDGFGYDRWLRCLSNNELLKTLSQQGEVSPLTTVFPSTTAAALTTLATGLTPQEHAVPEWFLYLREIDMIVESVPFKPLGEKNQDRLAAMGVDPRILYQGDTMYEILGRSGVETFTFIHESIAHSAYSQLIHGGSNVVPFLSPAECVVRLRKTLEHERAPAHFYVYVGDVDSAAHKYGPYSEECEAEVSGWSRMLKTEFLDKVHQETASETLLIVTGDHGTIDIAPQETVYLNEYPGLTHALLKGEGGAPILPTGSPRDMFLHVEPSRIEEMQAFLSDRLGEKATVMKASEAIKAGLFGVSAPRKEFYDRIGSLVVLPHSHHTVWYKHPKGKRFDALGYHGGLHREEMLIPFAIARLSDLAVSH